MSEHTAASCSTQAVENFREKLRLAGPSVPNESDVFWGMFRRHVKTQKLFYLAIATEDDGCRQRLLVRFLGARETSPAFVTVGCLEDQLGAVGTASATT